MLGEARSGDFRALSAVRYTQAVRTVTGIALFT